MNTSELVKAKVKLFELGDATNGGKSSRRDFIYVSINGIAPHLGDGSDVTEVNGVPVFLMTYSSPAGRTQITLVPASGAPSEEKNVGPMMGGNYAEVPGFSEPIPIHDRYETWAQYDALTR